MPANTNPLPDVPADLKGLLRDLDLADDEARQLVNSLNDQQLNWRPDGGTRWSVAQCLDHLAQINAIYIAALSEAVHGVKPSTEARRDPIQPGWLARWFIGVLEPPPKRKLKSPKKALPSAQKAGTEVLRAFIAAHDQARALIQEAGELDLNRIRFKNPFIGFLRFTVGSGLLIINAHDRRHLWQARQVLASMERGQAQGGAAVNQAGS
ncbi:MAG TPA: DinB family protein [Verrucomicrobiae bacterium]|nr:DinB family protein [Verrucomicrobiae bacterium]